MNFLLQYCLCINVRSFREWNVSGKWNSISCVIICCYRRKLIIINLKANQLLLLTEFGTEWGRCLTVAFFMKECAYSKYFWIEVDPFFTDFFTSNNQPLPTPNLQANAPGGRTNPTTLVGPQGTPATPTAPTASLAHPQGPAHMHQAIPGMWAWISTPWDLGTVFRNCNMSMSQDILEHDL